MSYINPNDPNLKSNNYFNSPPITPQEAQKIIEELFQDLVNNQAEYPNYVELVGIINTIRGKVYDPAHAGNLSDLINQAKEALGKEGIQPEMTQEQKAALARYEEAKAALEELQQKTKLLPSQISNLEALIKLQLEELKKCEGELSKLTGTDLAEAKELYNTLKQQLQDAQESLDFLKNEYTDLGKTQASLMTDLGRYVQDMEQLKNNILQGTDTAQLSKELEAIFKEFKQKTSDYDHSLAQDKADFERNQTSLKETLDEASKDLTNLQELVDVTPSEPEEQPPIAGGPAKPTGNETAAEAAKKANEYFEYLAAHYIELGFSYDEYKEAVSWLNGLRVSISNMSPADRKAALEKAYESIRPLSEEAKAAKKAFEDMTKILDTLKNINNPAALKSLIEELKKLLAECEGKPGANDYQTVLSALVQIESTLNALAGNVSAYVTELQKFVSQIEQLNNAIKQETNAQKRQDLLSQINSLVSQMQTYMVNNSISIDGLNQEVSDIEANLQKTKLDIRELRRETGLAPAFDDEKGQDMYFDFGIFQNDIQKFVDGSTNPPSFKMEAFKEYLDDLFARLGEAGINKLFLSFAQLANIEYLSGTTNTVPGRDATDRDTILQIFNISKDCGLAPDAIFKQFIDSARDNNCEINLSIGGERATVENFSIGNNPTAAATAMFEFMKKYNITSIDIDIEGAPVEAVNRNPEGFQQYFKELHRLLKEEGAGRKVFLTPLADWTHAAYNPNISYPNSSAAIIEALFFDREGNSIFREMFDGLNLMTYSASQYYLDGDHDTWGIEQWIDLIGGPQFAYMISLGLEDNIPYQTPGANANPANDYTIKPGSTAGEGAAQVYLQLVAQLMKDGYLPLDAEGPNYGLGKTFGWPDNSRDVTYHGVNDFMKDFMEYLKDFSPKEYLQ